jgi:hypothetical protein
MSEVLVTTQLSKNATYKQIDEDLFELTLSTDNKAELFEEGISQLSRSSTESTSILEGLNIWNPSDASRFVPRSSATILNTPFRLIFPNSALPSFDETGLYVRQYLAISYCWHSDEFLPTGYERYGSWPISRPFVEAILGDKDHPREGIWMDQLCIDQSSSIDKGKSVAAMDVIYRSCIRLVILLEDVFLNEREAALHEKYDPTKMEFQRTWHPEEDEKEVFASFYNKVNAARWWKRAWCLHEFSVNDPWTDKRQCNNVHNATFILNGPEGSTVKIKWFNLQLIMGSALFILSNAQNNILNTFNAQYIFSGVERGHEWNGNRRSSLMARHSGVMQTGSTYLSDRLRVIMNMCGLGLAYVGDELATDDNVLYLSALLALALGETYPLSMFNPQSVVLDNQPTWLCRGVGPGDTSMPAFNRGRANGIHRISTQEIELDMICFNLPWDFVKDEDLKATYMVFPDTIPTTEPDRHVSSPSQESTTSSYSDDALDTRRRRFLAGCITNGYSFTSRLWAQLEREVVVPNYNAGVFRDLAPNPSLHNAASELIDQLLPVSSLLCIPSPSAFTLDDAHLFLTWLTDPRSVYYIGAHTPRLCYTTDSDRAFVTALHTNEHFDDGPAEELQVAVPTDLLNATCMALRVWILRPAKGEDKSNKWRLVGKALLLGEPDLMQEAKLCSGQQDAAVVMKGKLVVAG